jgi:2-polyprenyl-3-methyl-5-hydroxy-6-metoxy-1,4-benzoquinol methylase
MVPRSKEEVDSICKIIEQYGEGKDARILDYSCGIGRHSFELAKRNFKVVGYDPSPFYIRYAKIAQEKKKNRNELDVKFVCGHPLSISKSSLRGEKFEVVLLMGCLGLVNDEYDITILKNVAKMLNRGSVLIMELENRDWTIRNFQSCTHHQFRSLELFEDWKFNPNSSISESVSRFYKKEKNFLKLLLELRTHIRLYSLHEVVKMLEFVGLRYLNCFDNILELIPLQNRSEDMVVVARK